MNGLLPYRVHEIIARMVDGLRLTVIVVSTGALAGCGTIGGSHLASPALDAGRVAETRDVDSVRARGTAIAVGPLNVVGFACKEKTSDLVKAADAKECMPLDEVTKHRLERLLVATVAVVSSTTFQTRANSDDWWFESAGDSDTLYGHSLLAIYPSKLPNFVVEVTNDAASNEAAATEIGPPATTCPPTAARDCIPSPADPPRIMISRDYLDTWDDRATGPADSGWDKNATLIDTLAHEMTHLLAVNDPPIGVMTDASFSLHPCKMGHLVSYKVGHLAECVARGTSGAGFSACMTKLHRDMHVPWYTYLWNWTRGLCDRYPE